tara:strand:- start:84 stop:881 length:798 start_codon:yes stop_codon:yes gene_type:complete
MAVWTDTGGVGSFATGTGTSSTAVQDIQVPSNAVELVSISGHVHNTAPAPAESMTGIFTISGKDWQQGDYEFFSEIGGSHLGAINGTPYYAQPRYWPAYQPVRPNSVLGLTYEAMDALAGNGQCMITCKWSDTPTGNARINRKATRETATSTSTGSSLTLAGATNITAFTVAVSTTTVGADDPSNGKIQVNSGNLLGNQTLELAYNLHGIEATSGQQICNLQHADVSIPVNPAMTNSVTFSSTLTELTALGTAGQWAYSISYNPV